MTRHKLLLIFTPCSNKDYAMLSYVNYMLCYVYYVMSLQDEMLLS